MPVQLNAGTTSSTDLDPLSSSTPLQDTFSQVEQSLKALMDRIAMAVTESAKTPAVGGASSDSGAQWRMFAPGRLDEAESDSATTALDDTSDDTLASGLDDTSDDSVDGDLDDSSDDTVDGDLDDSSDDTVDGDLDDSSDDSVDGDLDDSSDDTVDGDLDDSSDDTVDGDLDDSSDDTVADDLDDSSDDTSDDDMDTASNKIASAVAATTSGSTASVATSAAASTAASAATSAAASTTASTAATQSTSVDGGGPNSLTIRNTTDKPMTVAFFRNLSSGTNPSFDGADAQMTIPAGGTAQVSMPADWQGRVQKFDGSTQDKANWGEINFEQKTGKVWFDESDIPGRNASIKMTADDGTTAGTDKSVLGDAPADAVTTDSAGQKVIDAPQWFTGGTNQNAVNYLDQSIGNSTAYVLPDDNNAVRVSDSHHLTIDMGNA